MRTTPQAVRPQLRSSSRCNRPVISLSQGQPPWLTSQHQPINFSCSVPSVPVVCTFAPSVVTPSGGTGSTTVQMQFPASAGLAPHSGPFDGPKTGIVYAFLLCGTLIGFTRCKTLRTRKSGMHLLLLLASLGMAMGLSGCGASTYSELFTLTITGTSGTVSHQAAVQVLVSKPK
jgi:hypothetical protein